MAKVDYTKVEKIFDEGILEYDTKVLLYLATSASDMGTEGSKTPFDQYRVSPKVLLRNIEQDLRMLCKNTPGVIDHLKINREELKKFFQQPDSLGNEELKKLQEVTKRIDSFKKELRKKLIEEFTDEDLVKIGKKNSIHHRFNKPDHWLPLH